MLNRAAPNIGPKAEDSLNSVIGSFAQATVNLKYVAAYLTALIATESEQDKTVQAAKLKGIAQAEGILAKLQLDNAKTAFNLFDKHRDQPGLVDYKGAIAEIEAKWQCIPVQELENLTDPSKPVDFKAAQRLLTECKELRCAIGQFTIPKRIRRFIEEGFAKTEMRNFLRERQSGFVLVR